MASLHTPEATKALRKKHGQSELDEDEEYTEGMSSDHAWLFPVFGSAVLLSLYLAFKYLEKDMILMVINAYFALAGCLAIPNVLVHLCRIMMGPHVFGSWQKKGIVFCTQPCLLKSYSPATPAPKPTSHKKGMLYFYEKVSVPTLVFFGLVCGIIAIYLMTKNWILANVIAICLAIQGIMLITLDSFATGFILLGGLFLYDIFWVFGSSKFAGQSVMVSVATNFDGPIKIVVPRNVLEVLETIQTLGWKFRPALQFSLLGLGDIVVPGVFVALALSFDQKLASEKRPSLTFTRFFYDFPKPYFTACMSGYVLGLAMTMGVMHVFKAGQPALLYLSPACSFAALLTAYTRNEIKDMWSWVNPASQEPKSYDTQASSDKTE